MPPLQQKREELISQLSGGRGFAFLTSGQKEELNRLTGNVATPSGAVVNAYTGQTIGVPETTILSNVSGKEKFDQQVQPTIDKANQAVAVASERAKARQEEPVEAKPPSEIPPEVQAEMDTLKTQQQKADELYQANLEKQKQNAQEQVNSLTLSATKQAEGQILALNKVWEQRKRDLATANAANLATWKQQFLRTGQAEYLPGITGDFLSAKEQEGQKVLSQLNDDYLSAVAQVNSALEAKKFQLAAQKTEDILKLEEKAIFQMKESAKEAQAINERVRQAIKDSNAQAETKRRAMFDYSQRIAPEVAAQLEQLPDEKSRQAYIDTIASTLGIDPFLLRGDVNKEVLSRNQKAIEQMKREELGERGGLTPFQTVSLRNQLEDNLRQNPAVKAYGELVNFGVPVVLDRFQKGQVSSVSDTVLMRTLAKVTDPTTGVREEEYRTFEDAVGSLNKLRVMPQKWIGKGRLTETGRKEMILEIQDRYKGRLEDYREQYRYYQRQAERAGVTIPPPYGVSGQTSGGIKVRNLKTGEVQPYNGTLTPEEAKQAGYEIVP